MGCSPAHILRRIFGMICEASHQFLADLISSKMFFLSFCLFAILAFPYLPLWLRGASFITSVTAVSCISGLLLIHLLRLASFAVLWSLSLGKRRFWWLPNLTADCCFSDSFKPLYSYETENSRLFGNNQRCTNNKITTQTSHSRQAEKGKKKLLNAKKKHLD